MTAVQFDRQVRFPTSQVFAVVETPQTSYGSPELRAQAQLDRIVAEGHRARPMMDEFESHFLDFEQIRRDLKIQYRQQELLFLHAIRVR
ncbi:MAG: hypothetical protein EBQ64_02910 [Acidimicrobiia bacterium]|nr:hypothetical protein [Acidimicrobiia bacterium]